MKLVLTEEQEFVRDTARKFLEKEAPLERVRKSFDLPGGFERTYWSQACALGWTGLAASEAAGGVSASGNRVQDCAIIAEVMGALVSAGPFTPVAVVLDAITHEGFEDEDAIAEALICGEGVASLAFAERGNQWAPSRFSTKVEQAGGDVVLSGAKAYVEHGAESDWMLVTARSGQGLTQLMVPAREKGVTVSPSRSVDFVRRFAEVSFDNVRLPGRCVVGEWGGAAAQVDRQIAFATLLQCAETNGALECAFAFTVDYMRQRHAFGRPIASYQALKHRLADAYLQMQTAMATTDAAIEALDSGRDDALELMLVAKTYVGVKSTELMGELVQMTGGIAVTWDHDLHLYERRIAVNRAMYGTPEASRQAVHGLLAARGANAKGSR